MEHETSMLPMPLGLNVAKYKPALLSERVTAVSGVLRTVT
jgi:hypothetical protein